MGFGSRINGGFIKVQSSECGEGWGVSWHWGRVRGRLSTGRRWWKGAAAAMATVFGAGAGGKQPREVSVATGTLFNAGETAGARRRERGVASIAVDTDSAALGAERRQCGAAFEAALGRGWIFGLLD